MVNLLPLQTWVQPGPGPLLPQLRSHLAVIALRQAGLGAQPLRWAITAVDPARGLHIEAVVLVERTAANLEAPPDPQPSC